MRVVEAQSPVEPSGGLVVGVMPSTTAATPSASADLVTGRSVRAAPSPTTRGELPSTRSYRAQARPHVQACGAARRRRPPGPVGGHRPRRRTGASAGTRRPGGQSEVAGPQARQQQRSRSDDVRQQREGVPVRHQVVDHGSEARRGEGRRQGRDVDGPEPELTRGLCGRVPDRPDAAAHHHAREVVAGDQCSALERCRHPPGHGRLPRSRDPPRRPGTRVGRCSPGSSHRQRTVPTASRCGLAAITAGSVSTSRAHRTAEASTAEPRAASALSRAGAPGPSMPYTVVSTSPD